LILRISSVQSLHHDIMALVSSPINTGSLWNTQSKFQTDSAVHIVNTRDKYHHHRAAANNSCSQHSKYYAGTKISNSLACRLKVLLLNSYNLNQC